MDNGNDIKSISNVIDENMDVSEMLDEFEQKDVNSE